VAAEQQQLADRIGQLIVDHDGALSMGQYPSRFTTLHDLSSRYLWQELIECQRHLVATIESLIPQLPGRGAAEALAQECLGVARAHLDSLLEDAPPVKPQPN
jgi:hypothetical protein